jgi:hypothetical protein
MQQASVVARCTPRMACARLLLLTSTALTDGQPADCCCGRQQAPETARCDSQAVVQQKSSGRVSTAAIGKIMPAHHWLVTGLSRQQPTHRVIQLRQQRAQSLLSQWQLRHGPPLLGAREGAAALVRQQRPRKLRTKQPSRLAQLLRTLQRRQSPPPSSQVTRKATFWQTVNERPGSCCPPCALG